jgi:hypothetical protein
LFVRFVRSIDVGAVGFRGRNHDWLPSYRTWVVRRAGFVLVVLALPTALLNGQSQGLWFGIMSGSVQALAGAFCIWALPRLL